MARDPIESAGAHGVTVVVPAYQAAAFLRATLETVANQTRRPSELIVVDDGSTDATCTVAEAFIAAHRELPARLLRQPHRGPGASRNAGIAAARTEWVAFLDSDDLWLPRKLDVIDELIRARPDANFFCHDEVIRNLDGSELVVSYGSGFSFEESIPKQLYLNNRFSTSAVVCRRDLLLKWRGFDENLSSGQDYELWLRMSPDLVPVFVSEVLGMYVLRRGNITTSRYWRRLLNMLKIKHRHREKGGWGWYLYSLARVVAYHVATPLVAFVRRSSKRG